MVCEYIDQKYNMELLFRWRRQQKKSWKVFELEKIAASLLNALNYLQSIGICHRDIKPANLFIMPKCDVKLIDFGEAKGIIISKIDEPIMSTIRGTPQYLSPILWKAHVVDGNAQQVKHNAYKSDVFSCGLVLIQLALMDDVTGFNQKSHEHNGELLIEKALHKIGKSCSRTYCELIRQMLRFNEAERPTFFELANTFLENSSASSKLKRLEGDKELMEEYSESSLGYMWGVDEVLKKVENNIEENKHAKNKTFRSLATKKGGVIIKSINKDNQNILTNEESKEKLLTQAELFKGYAKINNLYVEVTDLVHWFEYGGNLIGEYKINQSEGRWKLIGRYKHEFSYHFVIVLANKYGHFLLGPNLLGTCVQYKDRKLVAKKGMPQTKSFFCGIYLTSKIYTFGGYDITEKLQLKTCEIYDADNDNWIVNPTNLNKARSQAAVCVMDRNTMYIFGGYNKEVGTLGSIEKYNIKNQSIELLKVCLPNPLRRFGAIKISPMKILLLGGMQKMNKENNTVYCFDLENEQTIEKLDRLSKGGIIEAPIVADPIGNLHLFVESENGTAPPIHVSYTFLEYS